MSQREVPEVLLARRLFELRTATWPGFALTQVQVAKALGVSPPSVSSWENQRTPTTPPVRRLRGYARLFGTARSLENGRVRLLPDEELSEDERAQVAALERDLLARVSASPANDGRPVTVDWTFDDFWRFAEGTDITIVCAPLPQEFRAQMRYADPGDKDYVQMYAYADLDALLELYGHVRAVNPNSQVNIRLASAMETDDYTSHLVVLGGVDWNTLTSELLNDLDLPVRQVPSQDAADAVFEVVDNGQRQVFGPVLRRDGDVEVLIEDVAHFFRAPSPYNAARTVTICNGVYGRGTYAAVRTLTDKRFRERNTRYVRNRFGPTFSILARARIRGREAVTPDWSEDHTRLHEWPVL